MNKDDTDSANIKLDDQENALTSQIEGLHNAPPKSPEFAIIGIGTSAGGLEVLRLVFDNVPSNFKHTFVIVQHLSPDYKSLMADLLAKNTSLNIFEVTNEMEVQPGSIYLIPPGKNMTLHKNHLRLTDKPTGHILNLPINIFFESLAIERKEQAIGIVLSGTGSDGSRGVRAIKEVGGMVMVQRPDTAAFDGMPNSAIATGLVDYVLAPEQMPDDLLRFLNTPRGLMDNSEALTAEGQVAFTQILRLLKQQTDLDFSWYKRPTLLRRMERRLTINNCSNLSGYLRFLQSNPGEAFILYREFLIGVTHFFRDPEAWRILEKDVLPQLVREKHPREPVKVWIVGCSSGEEAYTIGMLLQEALQQNGRLLDVKIFATDIEKEHLDKGAQGIYPESIVTDISFPRLQKFFTKRGDQYQVTTDLRRTIIFSQHNALSDPPFGRMDLVICRNFMIYLQPEVQKRLIDTLHYALNKNGILFLGPSESLGNVKSMFEEISQRWRIYRNNEVARSIGHTSHLNDLYSSIGSGQRQRQKRSELQMADVLNQTLLQQLNAACVYIDESFNILHAIGNYQDYLRLPEGAFSTNLLDMAPDKLKLALSTAVRKAIRINDQTTIVDAWQQEENGSLERLHLMVSPFHLPAGGGKCFLVLFMPAPINELLPPISELATQKDYGPEHTLMLEEALKDSQTNLQTALEEAQTTNEELQATNEELMASNEELQSTNEELQSVNEELHTVNTEYQSKIDELAALNADIDNLLRSTQIGTIFLDTNKRIRRFTPTVQSQFDLMNSDIGRPLEHLAGKFKPEDVQRLNAHIVTVLNNGQPSEEEVQTRDGRYYLQRVHPFINANHEIGGVVLSFVDISPLKKAQQSMIATEKLLNYTEKNAHVGSWEMDMATGDSIWSDEFFRICGFEPGAFAPTAEKGFEIIHPEDRERASEAIHDSIANKTPYKIEKRIVRPDGSIRHVLSEGNVVLNEQGEPDKIRGSFTDITERKQAEEATEVAEYRYLTLFNTMAQGVVYQNSEGAIISVNPAAERLLGLSLDQMQGRTSIDPRWRAIHEDGSDFPGETHPAMVALRSGQMVEGQIMGVFNPAKNQTIWLKVTAVPEFCPGEKTAYQVYATFDDITPVRIKTVQLQTALHELQQSNHELEQFAYVASHDLQEPLNTIANFIGLLQDDYAADMGEIGLELLDLTHEAALRMKKMIEALLQYSRRRAVELSYEPIDCAQMITDLNFDLQALITRTHAEISYNHCAQIFGDSRMIRQVLQNLLTNAIKFGRPDVPPKIDISVIEEPDHWRIMIKDNGIGIAEKSFEEIFGLFRRLHNRDEYDGTGLGLTLCKQIVELHGGKIWLTSEPGEGTTFYFTLAKRENQHV